jgi:hypothetical protein
LNPRTWVPKAGTLPLDHRSRYIGNYTDDLKNMKSLFILLKKAQAVVQKTSRKNVTSTVPVFFFSVFLMDVMGGKITVNLK